MEEGREGRLSRDRIPQKRCLVNTFHSLSNTVIRTNRTTPTHTASTVDKLYFVFCERIVPNKIPGYAHPTREQFGQQKAAVLTHKWRTALAVQSYTY